MAKTDWQMGDTVLPDDLNQIGQEINQNRDNLAAHTAATTGVHGATSAATPNTIVQRDSAGRFKAAAPAASDDVARKADVDAVSNNLNGWRIYNDVTELGLTPGSETMEEICESIPDRSELRFTKLTSNPSTAYPADAGMLFVRRHSIYRVELRFLRGLSNTAEEWVGYYDTNITPNFSGWIKLARSVDLPPYETGTWIPELRFGNETTGITYTDRFGRYTRIGNVVFWELDIVLSSKGTAIGDASIAGLPFASNNSRPYSNTVGGYANITLPSNATGMVFYIPNNSSIIVLRQIGNGMPVTQAFDDSHFTNNSFLRAQGKYTI